MFLNLFVMLIYGMSWLIGVFFYVLYGMSNVMLMCEIIRYLIFGVIFCYVDCVCVIGVVVIVECDDKVVYCLLDRLIEICD